MGTMFGMRTNYLGSRIAPACLFLAGLFSTSPRLWAQQPFVPTVIATPGSPSTVLYGLYGSLNSLVRSNDLGKTWVPLYITQAGLPQPAVQGFAIDPGSPNQDAPTIYVSTSMAAGSIWKSLDGGNTWNQASSGLPVSGGPNGYFNIFTDTTGTYLYLQVANHIYRSQNGGALWQLQSVLPTPSGTLFMTPTFRNQMYYIDTATLTLYTTMSEGSQWIPGQQVPGSTGATIAAMGVPYYDPNTLYLTVNVPVLGSNVIASVDGAAFADQTGAGLGPFTQIVSAASGPTYAFGNPFNGTFRSLNSGQTWQTLGLIGSQHSGATAIDPNVRTTLYGVEITLPSTSPTELVESIDSGTDWTAIPSTILPTIAKPVPMFNLTLEQGAPYSASFSVQTAENPAWQTPVTVTTSGEPWIQLGATAGNTPLADSITISTAGLLPGVYTSTITIAASQSFNKSVAIPVQLTVKPLGGLGPGYLITTAAGNGNPGNGAATGCRFTGDPTCVAVGDAKAVSLDPFGNIDFSAGNRIWQLSSGGLTTLAGNGVNGSSGDGQAPLAASVSDPDAIAYDSTGAMYFTEFVPERVRKLSAGNLSTELDMTRSNPPQPVGSHALVLDPTLFMLLPVPAEVLRYNGSALTAQIPRLPLTKPYGMLEDGSGNLYVSDMALNQVLEITPTGGVTVVAGTGIAGFGGDGGAAPQAMLNAPAGITFDSQGTLYIADSGNNRIRTVTTDGNIHTIAGSGLSGYAGDNSTADFASFMNPLGVAVDASGNVYVADAGNNRLRVLMPQSTPTPVLSAMQGPNRATKLAPGGLFSLYGGNLAAAGYSNVVQTNTWPRDIGGIAVTINGVAAPLYFVSATQINGQIPFETALGTGTAVVTVNGSMPAPINFSVVAAEPDVLAQGGGTQAVAVNQSGAVNTSAAPAHAGDIEVVYLSGIGIPSPTVPTGAPSPGGPLARANYPYQILLNGQQVPASPYDFLGYAPGFPALAQANFQIPSNVTGNLSLVITVNGQSSVATIISVH